MKGYLFVAALVAALAVTATLPRPAIADDDEPLLTPFLDSLYEYAQEVNQLCEDNEIEFLCDTIGIPDECKRYPPQPVCPTSTLPPKTVWPQYLDLVFEEIPFVYAVDQLIGTFMDFLTTNSITTYIIDENKEECTDAILEYVCQWIHGQLGTSGGCTPEDKIREYLPCFDDCVAIFDNCLDEAKEDLAELIEDVAENIAGGLAGSIKPMDIISIGLDGKTSCGFLGADECVDMKFRTRFKTDTNEANSPWSFLAIALMVCLGIVALTALVALVLWNQRNAALAAYYDKDDDDMMTQKSGWTRASGTDSVSVSEAGSDATSLGASSMGMSSNSGTTWGGSSRATAQSGTSQVSSASRATGATRSSRGSRRSRGSKRSRSSRGNRATKAMPEDDLVSAVSLDTAAL